MERRATQSAREECDTSGVPTVDSPHIEKTQNGSALGDGTSNEEMCPKAGRAASKGFKLPASLQWIPANWTWSNIKPVIRCAVAAWVAAVFFIISRVEIFMGQAGFLILIASFLSPPSDPFVAVLEREVLIVFFVAAAWAWGCFGIKMADLARSVRDQNASFPSTLTGRYIETAPTIIMAVFIFIGCTVLLYIKARQGQGPYLFACIFGCICLDISFTTAVFVPYPFYDIGKSIVIPLGLRSALAILSSVLIFPSTVSAQFTARLQGVLSPLAEALALHQTLLRTPPHTPTFAANATAITALVAKSEGALVPLAATARLLRSDVIFGRYAPGDFHALQFHARRIVGRANGMGVYFTLIDPTRERFPVTPAPSIPATPTVVSHPAAPSRSPSLEHMGRSNVRLHEASESPAPRSGIHHPHPHLREGHRHALAGGPHSNSRHHHPHTHPQHDLHYHHPHLLRESLLSLSAARARGHGHGHGHTHGHEHAVGVFESQRYLNLEATRFSDPDAEAYIARTTALLSESCDALLGVCRAAVLGVQKWLEGVRKGRFRFWITQEERTSLWEKRVAELQALRDGLSSAFDQFRRKKRHRILDPYLPVFEPKSDREIDQVIPAHRYLFHCYVYEYHLIQFVSIVLEMLDEVLQLEKERRTNRVWTPSVKRFLRWNIWEVPENVEQEDDEDPEFIQGLDMAFMEDLGMPRRRDPDALPPRNALESFMSHLHYGITSLGGGNALFALKAGVLTVLLCLPSLLKSSAPFAYRNRFVWVIFMGQLTLARFRGDTAYGLTARILSTFLGGIVGMIMWYVSAGSGRGNAYGLAAVCAVCFPFFFYARLYFPGPPMANIIFFVTAALVVGYSWQDFHIPVPASPGAGFSIAWRRFVLVTVGVVAAFIMSFFPPSTTIRRYHRATLATTSTELGALYCSILSYATVKREEDVQEITTGLLSIRSKLKRSVVLRTNVLYECSLRGRWPVERYHNVLEIQLQIAYSLSHLMSTIKHLEPAWTRALLRRSGFLDPDFEGDILAVITMTSSSLRNGIPLPQITPCPLLDRFMMRYHSSDVIHKESEDDYGLPRTLTLDTLQNEQYLTFCVGVSTAFSIITRLDRLMLAVKEIVGEQYHIHGIGLPTFARDVEYGTRASLVHFGSPQDV